MAVVNVKSTAITNDDSIPKVNNFKPITGGEVKTVRGTVEVAADNDNNSVYRMAKVPDTAFLDSILLWNDAITAGTDYNVGIFDVNDGSVVDDNLFADALDLSSAGAARELRFSALDINTIEKPLYELLGLSASSGKDYHIGLTGIVVGTAAGTLTMKVQYSY